MGLDVIIPTMQAGFSWGATVATIVLAAMLAFSLVFFIIKQS